VLENSEGGGGATGAKRKIANSSNRRDLQLEEPEDNIRSSAFALSISKTEIARSRMPHRRLDESYIFCCSALCITSTLSIHE